MLPVSEAPRPEERQRGARTMLPVADWKVEVSAAGVSSVLVERPTSQSHPSWRNGAGWCSGRRPSERSGLWVDGPACLRT